MCSLRTTRHTAFARCIVCVVVSVVIAQNADGQSGWKAATNKAIITPEQPMWMSGYSSRDHMAEGKLHDLWVKALVLEDPGGTRDRASHGSTWSASTGRPRSLFATRCKSSMGSLDNKSLSAVPTRTLDR